MKSETIMRAMQTAMRAIQKKSLVYGLAACLICLAQPDALAVQETKARIEEQIKQTRQRIEETEKLLKDLKKNYSGQEKQLQKLEQSIQENQKKIKHIQSHQAGTNQKIQDLKVQIEQLEAERQTQKQALSLEIQMAYRQGRFEFLKELLNQQNPETSLRFYRYHQYLQTARTDKIQDCQLNLVDFNDKQQTLKALMEQLKRSEENLLAHQNALEADSQQRKQLLKQFSSEENHQKAQLKDLELLLASLPKKLQALSRQSNHGGPVNQMKGRLLWPVDGRVTERFGARRQGLKTEWKGVFIQAPSGKAVRAVHAGEVIFANWLRGFGLLCIIDHGQGVLSLYGHNSHIVKALGDRVAAGEVIAAVGESGGQAQPGLYFEMRQKGEPVNPLIWLAKQ